LPLEQNSHQDHVFVDAINLGGVTLQAFDLEADPLVKLDRDRVVFPNRQFDPAQPKGLRRAERLLDQTRAYSLPPEFRQKRDAENAAMRINRPWLGRDIAPADDLPGRHRDQLRITLLDIVENEGRTDSSGGASRNER
jgi:hypothetical protein